jgi:hypothetical protein
MNYNHDLTGQVISATVQVSADSGATIVAQPDQCTPNGASPTVRIEFQDTTSGAWTETDYWWSHAGSVPLSGAETSPVTITADPANLADWSDIYGHSASDPAYTAAFDAAVQNAKIVSLSFGGYCHYANGVAVTGGGATFQLSSFTIG